MRILLITCYYYPQNRISVLRVGQWAKYWALQGHEVTVLTTYKYPFLGPYGLHPPMPDGVQVIEVPYLPDWLCKRLGHPGHATDTNTSKENGSQRLRRRVRRLRSHIGSLMDIHDLWIRPARRKAMELMSQQSYDAIVSSFSPPAAHMVASRLKQAFPNTIWLADFRDLWAYNHITSAKGLLRHLETTLEIRTMRDRADALMTVSAPLANDLRERYPNLPVWVVENGFDPQEFPDWATRIATAPDANGMLRISYTGTLYPGRRDPTPLLVAVNRLIEEGVLQPDRVAIDFYGHNERELADILEACDGNRHGVVHVHGFVSRQDSLAAQSRSSLLLLLESSEPAARGVLTGKVFEYLVSGIPILAVGIGGKNAAGALILETGTGFCATTADEIAAMLARSVQSGRFDFYAPKTHRIAAYARDRQAEQITALLQDMQVVSLSVDRP